jgi:N-carbamoyl-L-amino-acid hydrolase
MNRSRNLAAAQLDRLTADLHSLAEFVDPSMPGWTRRALAEPYRESRSWVAALMKSAGLEVSRDKAGNILGRLPGQGSRAGALVTGSHTDSVVGGGRFDGICGVLGAIEAARCLRESGVQLVHDLLVVDFFGEETNDFGFGCLGSRAAAEGIPESLLNRRDPDDVPLHERLVAEGIDPGEIGTPVWEPGRVKAFIELHVEQGPTLAEQNLPIGVVTAVAGIERLIVQFLGRADHAGTRAMTDRRDAMVAAAQAVLAIQRIGCEAPVHGVATTTKVENDNPSPNVVASRVTMQSELRSIDASWLHGARRRVSAQILEAAQECGVDVEFDWATDNDVVPTDLVVQDTTAGVLDGLGIPWTPIPSGATHDAVHMAAIAPTGMIFIPSRNGGISHSPDEWTDAQDIATGVDALAAALVALDRKVG